MKIFKEIKKIGKRFLQNINLANAKKLLDISTDALKFVEEATPYLNKYSDKFSKIIKSPGYNTFYQGVQIADNILNRGSALSGKNTQRIQPEEPDKDLRQAEQIANNMQTRPVERASMKIERRRR